MRRNDVVYDNKESSPWRLYGRVWKFLPNGKVKWINCKYEVYESDQADLSIVEYTGKWEWEKQYYHKLPNSDYHDYNRIKYVRDPIWIPMPTLRKLKQKAR